MRFNILYALQYLRASIHSRHKLVMLRAVALDHGGDSLHIGHLNTGDVFSQLAPKYMAKPGSLAHSLALSQPIASATRPPLASLIAHTLGERGQMRLSCKIAFKERAPLLFVKL